MKGEKRKINCSKQWIEKYPGLQDFVRTGKKSASMKVTGNLFKGAIDCNYQQVVSESVQVFATQMASEKVAIMVATFLNFDS